jgi:hypothetical protein
VIGYRQRVGGNKRLYPISEEVFNKKVLPVIEAGHIWKGRPPKVSHYQVFCAILYILRTGCPWRDLPEIYGYWHVVFAGEQDGVMGENPAKASGGGRDSI